MGWFLLGLFVGCMIGVLLMCICASGAIADARRENAAWSKSAENPANYGSKTW
jgi:hypothetical protein